MLVRKKDILSFYDKVKKLAVSSLEKERYEDAVAYTNAAAEIAYRFNWMYRDDELEDILIKVSNRLVCRNESYVAVGGRCVMYVAALLDNRGIIQQYLRALMFYADKLLVIVERPYGDEGRDTVRELKACEKAELYILPEELSLKARSQLLYDKIVSFQPERLLCIYGRGPVLP